MIEPAIRQSIFLLATALMIALVAGPSRAAEKTSVPFGYLEIIDDPRYAKKLAYARIRIKPHDRPFPGAELAIHKSRILGRAMKIEFTLERAQRKTAAGLAAEVERLFRRFWHEHAVLTSHRQEALVAARGDE